MKRRILILVASLSASLAASADPTDWRIIKEGRVRFAVFSTHPNVKIPLEKNMGGPKLLSWNDSPVSKDVGVLIYEAGVVGTSTLYKHQYAVVIRKKNMEKLGEFLWHITAQGSAPLPKSQPIWDWADEGNAVHAENPETGEEMTASWSE